MAPRGRTYTASPMSVAAMGSYNINESNTSNFKSALNTSSSVAVAFMGDSTMRGVDEGAVPYNMQYAKYAVPMRVADKLNEYGVPATADNWYGLSGTSLADYLNRDVRLSASGTADVGSSVVQGGAGMSMSSATATMTFTPINRCDTADIYTMDNASFTGAQLSYSVDGGSATNITQAGNNTFRKTTISLGSLGIHTITITWVSGSNALYGIEAYDSKKNKIVCRQWGIAGGTASDMVLNTGTPSAGRLAQLAAHAPKLVICEGGIVNSYRNSTSVASVKSSLQTLITDVKAASCDFIFLTPPYDNGVTGLTADQDSYVKAMYELCDSNNVGLIDIRKYHESFKNGVLQGYMRPNDAVHMATAGYDQEADIIAKTILRLTL